jgi:hypothetical protein
VSYPLPRSISPLLKHHSTTTTTTSTTTTESPVCIPTAAPAQTAPAGLTCTTEGSASNVPAYFSTYSSDEGDCARMCLADSACKSFAWGPSALDGADLCELYSNSVTGDNLAAGYGSYSFSDAGCWTAAPCPDAPVTRMRRRRGLNRFNGL